MTSECVVIGCGMMGSYYPFWAVAVFKLASIIDASVNGRGSRTLQRVLHMTITKSSQFFCSVFTASAVVQRSKYYDPARKDAGWCKLQKSHIGIAAVPILWSAVNHEDGKVVDLENWRPSWQTLVAVCVRKEVCRRSRDVRNPAFSYVWWFY